jgi:hypothetical protein
MDPATSTNVSWTRPRDVLERARVLWERGTPLAAEAAGGPASIRVPLRGALPRERAHHFDALRSWIQTWEKAPVPMRVEWKSVNDRVLGRVRLPVAAHLDNVQDIATICGRQAQVELSTFRSNLAATPADLRWFAVRRPRRVASIGSDWPAVLSATAWLESNPNSGLHVRQIPAAGVHTKIVETYRSVIAELLRGDQPSSVAGLATGRGWFDARHGLATKPQRVRLRFLDASLPGATPYSDVEVPVDEAAKYPISALHLLFIENEITFLSLGPLPGAVAVFGGGRAAASFLHHVPWLLTAPIWYWGDIDTWGFVILDEVRSAAAGRTPVRSILMDEATLLRHRDRWVSEESPATAVCENLTREEAETYAGLRDGRWGKHVRLEQERIPWPDAERAVNSILGSGESKR